MKATNGICLDASQRYKRGGLVHMWKCDTRNKNQMWKYSASSGTMRSKWGICLDASQRNKVGGKVHLWTCNPSNKNQKWTYSGNTALATGLGVDVSTGPNRGKAHLIPVVVLYHCIFC